MKTKQGKGRSKLSISLPAEMAEWLHRASAKQYTNVSNIIREALMPHFLGRHAK